MARPRRLLDRLRRKPRSTRAESLEQLVAGLTRETGAERVDMLRVLVRDHWTDRAAVDQAMKAVARADDDTKRRAAELELRLALTPGATEILHLVTSLDDGVKLLVDLRADLLAVDDPELAPLERELYSHLATLFDVGLLELRRITWDAPASLLEKLIAYEAVHAIDSWADLKNRLSSDRRCYAFFHPAMPAEPLIFVEIALTTGIAGDLPHLLDEHAPDLDPEHADTAIFYSISSCQPGLAGVNLGDALIKQVVEQLGHDLPNVEAYATLSPIPGFRRWLDDALTGDLSPHERELLPAAPERVRARLADEEWSSDESVGPALLALCARYLTTTVDGRVLDPVGNFHLSNGASIERLNWLADPSPTGLQRSVGIMANYLYEPDRIAARAERYSERGEVAVSNTVRELLQWKS